jgi:hypothetical protein
MILYDSEVSDSGKERANERPVYLRGTVLGYKVILGNLT